MNPTNPDIEFLAIVMEIQVRANSAMTWLSSLIEAAQSNENVDVETFRHVLEARAALELQRDLISKLIEEQGFVRDEIQKLISTAQNKTL